MTGLSAKTEKENPSQQTPFWQHYHAGVDHLQNGRAEKASQRFKQAAIADPEIWCNNAQNLAKLGHPDMAISALYQLMELHPGEKGVLAAGWCAIGNIHYHQLADTTKALEYFRKSWDEVETHAAAADIALTNMRLGNLDEAERWINISLGMNPWSPEAQMIQADINFNRGNYRTAFRQYECRWRTNIHGLAKLPSNKREWSGTKEREGTLLVVGEQGLGDIILTLRYARLIKKLGLKQTWVVPQSMKSLVESMGVVDTVNCAGDVADYDFHISAASLPRVFKTTLETIPKEPYLKRYGRCKDTNFKVGLVWRGNKSNPNDAVRSTSLSQWAPVLEVPGVEFQSMQFGEGEDDAKAFPQIKVNDERPSSWLETARLVSGLDLVISVDTAMVHLCGAMGIPCWCAMHCRPYFVYPLCREDCPWYPSVRLFKQERELEWGPVFARIANELRNATR